MVTCVAQFRRTSGLLPLACLLFAAFLPAQTTHTSHRLDFEPPTDRYPNGAWVLIRDDAHAIASGEAGIVHRGGFEILAAAGPDFVANGLKLNHAGVIPAPDDSTVPTIGATWDYHHAVLRALAKIDPQLPIDPSRPAEWSYGDLDVFDFGRVSLPYLRARSRLEQLIEQTLWDGMARTVLIWALENAPETLPDVPNADNPARTSPWDSDPVARAVYRLGPEARAQLDLLLAELEDELSPTEAAYAAFLRRELIVLERAIGGAVASLQPGFPVAGDDRSRWPDADRAIVEQFNLAALRFLETLRATDSTFAPKADWLGRWVVREAAADLVNRLESIALAGNLADDHFEQSSGVETPAHLRGSLSGFRNGDDLLIFLRSREAIPTQINRLGLDARAAEGRGDAGGIAVAAAKRRVISLLQSALDRYTDPASGLPFRDYSRRMRETPGRATALTGDMGPSLRALRSADLGALMAERETAALFRSKMNHLREQVIARDQRIATDLFESGARRFAAEAGLVFGDLDYERMRRTGAIELTQEMMDRLRITQQQAERLVGRGYLEPVAHLDGTSGFAFAGNPAYRRLARLSERDLNELQERGFILIEPGVLFRGDQASNGRQYDIQENLAVKGLTINLQPPVLGPAVPIDLEPGRSYEFSFRYWTRGLNGQNTWVRFVPLDADGNPLIADFDNEDRGLEGEFTPFRFARYNPDGSFESSRYSGTSDGWQQARFLLSRVPDPVAGFLIEVKVDRLSGVGEVYYKDFRLELRREGFREDFEPNRWQASSQPDGRPLLAPTWSFVHDPDRRLMPAYSGVSYGTVNNPAGSTRSLVIEPRGFNVRLEMTELFELRPDRQYHFKAQMLTEGMGDMRAWYELLLYDRDGFPVTADGLPTTEGSNTLRTPMRGDETRQLSFGGLRIPAGWQTHELFLDELRAAELSDLRGRGDLARVDQRERRDIRFCRIAVVANSAGPVHTARIAVDNIEIIEYPRVTLTLGQQMLDPSSSLIPGERVWGPPEKLGNVMARPAPPADPDRFRLFIEVEVRGLAPRRSGYHYTLTLHDYLGNPVRALDILGAQSLDRIVHSNQDGAIGSEEFNRIYLDQLDLRNTFGYFSARFDLRYVDQPQPLYSREFLIGFVPPSLLGEDGTRSGEFGVVMDENSTRIGRLAPALSMLGVGRIAWPLLRRETSVDPGNYPSQAFVQEYETLMAQLPRVRRTAVLGEMPLELEALHPGSGAASVFADPNRTEWRDLMSAVHAQWTGRFDDWMIGLPSDQSYGGLTANSAAALDSLRDNFTTAAVDWSPRVMPITLNQPGSQGPMLDALARSFAARWQPALDAMPQAWRDAIAQSLDAPQAQRLRAGGPNLIWLREREELAFTVPHHVSPAAMQASINEILGRIGRYTNILGDDQAAAVAAATAIATGQPVDLAPLAGALAQPASHTLVLDLLPVDPSIDTTYEMQLRDLTEKCVLARQMGFTRIYVSRLRDSGNLPDGLMTADNRARPAFHAYRTLNSVLSDTDALPDQLMLPSGARHQFFRNRRTGELTFFVFPGANDAVEQLPFGHNVRQVDLMGNPLPVTDGATGGTVSVRLNAGGLPVILTGIDTALLDTVNSVSLTDPTIQAREADQARSITITNRFTSPLSVSLRIPLTGDQSDRDSIVRDARLADPTGVPVSDRSSEYAFAGVNLAPGETRTFDFQLRPRPTMMSGTRVLPVELQLKGAREYNVTRRIPVQIQPQITVTTIDLVDPQDGRGMELAFRVSNTTVRTEAFVASVDLPEITGTRPLTRDFSVAGNAEADVSRRLPSVPAAQLNGTLVRISIRQSPGSLFFNQDYRVRPAPTGTGWTLIPEQQSR